MSQKRVWPRRNELGVALIVVAIVVRLLMVWLLPALLDVYYYDAQAVKALLSGIDPYGFSYIGIPAWLATPDAANVFAYLPGVVLFLAPFGAFFDVRTGLIAADVVVGLAIYFMGGARARACAAVFLLLPFTILFSTSYPNNTLVGMAFLGTSAALWWRGSERLAPVLFGASLGSSQFIWLLFPLFLFWLLKSRKFVETAIALGVAVGLILPFLLWNPASFVYDTVIFQFTRAPRTLVTPAAFGFDVNPTLDGIAITLLGVAVPLVLRAALIVGATAVAAFKSRDLRSVLINSTWLMLAVTFILPNDLSWWYLELPFQTLLIFLATGWTRVIATAANP